VHWLHTFPGLADTVGTCVILTISLVLRITATDECDAAAAIDLDRELLLTGGAYLTN
jgi:hypothetical protein